MLVHTHQLLYIQQRNGEGENEKNKENYTVVVRMWWNQIVVF